MSTAVFGPQSSKRTSGKSCGISLFLFKKKYEEEEGEEERNEKRKKEKKQRRRQCVQEGGNETLDESLKRRHLNDDVDF